jgi:acyl-coenzyme A synthetase/AMP-(fatty) acid ligase
MTIEPLSPHERTPAEHLTFWAAHRPNSPWIETDEQTLTFANVERMVGQFDSYFTTMGIREGHVVALDVSPSLHAILTVALFRLGAISCQYPRLVAAASFHCEWLISTSVTESVVSDHTLYLAAHNISLIDELAPNADQSPLTTSDPFRLLFSSGTTGRPKAMAVSAALMDQRGQFSAATRPPSDAYFCAMDVSTTAGLRTLLWCLREGSPYLVPGDGSHNLKQMLRHGVEVATMSPDQMRALLEAAEAVGEHLPSLHTVIYAGSSLDESLARRFREWFSVELFTSLGSTEAGIITVRSYDTDDLSDLGFVASDLELQIVDETDTPLPHNSVGLVRYRRPRDPFEYFRDPEATQRVFRDGWCYPGDLGELTEGGQLFFRGRADNVINVGGIKVDPALYDAVAREVIGVTDAAGFVFRDEDDLDVLAIAIVTTFGFLDQDLLDAMTQAFGSRQPSMVIKVDEIPKTSTGKTIRGELTALVERTLRPQGDTAP